MEDQLKQNGSDIAQSLYGNETGVFQVRNLHGNKIAEFNNKDQTKAFLQKQNKYTYEIWHLDNEPPSDLKGIYSGAEFLNQ